MIGSIFGLAIIMAIFQFAVSLVVVVTGLMAYRANKKGDGPWNKSDAQAMKFWILSLLSSPIAIINAVVAIVGAVVYGGVLAYHAAFDYEETS